MKKLNNFFLIFAKCLLNFAKILSYENILLRVEKPFQQLLKNFRKEKIYRKL